MGTKTIAALSAIIVAIASGATYQLIDINRAGDGVRSGDFGRIVDSVGPTAPLGITVTRARNINGGWNVVFPRSADAAAARYARSEPMTGDLNGNLNNELDDGAYFTEGASISIEVQGRRNEEITITDVRPILTREEIPDGTLLNLDSQGGGGETELMMFDLDSPSPIPKTVDPQNSSAYRPFFDVKRITLRDHEKDTIQLLMRASAAAYSFGVAIDYELGGERHTQIVDRGGQPFRVAAYLCGPTSSFGTSVPQSVIQDLRSRRYETAYRSDFTTYPYMIARSDVNQVCSYPR